MFSTKNILIYVGLAGLAYWYWKGMDKSKGGKKGKASDAPTKSEFVGTGSRDAYRKPKECFKAKGGGLRTLWTDGSVTNGCQA